MSEPQSDALTTSPQPPYQEQYLLYIFHQIMSRTFLIIFNKEIIPFNEIVKENYLEFII